MERTPHFAIPDELEFLTFFGSEPRAKAPADGFWLYEVADERDVRIRLSLKVLERSVQTVVTVHGQNVDTVSSEGATQLAITASELRCEFEGRDWKTTLKLQIRPAIKVSWSTLQISG
jgi:hypothetical protein